MASDSSRWKITDGRGKEYMTTLKILKHSFFLYNFSICKKEEKKYKIIDEKMSDQINN